MSRTQTRIGSEISKSARGTQKACLAQICKIMDNLLNKRYIKIAKLAKSKSGDKLLAEIVDFKSLMWLRDGICP